MADRRAAARPRGYCEHNLGLDWVGDLKERLHEVFLIHLRIRRLDYEDGVVPAQSVDGRVNLEASLHEIGHVASGSLDILPGRFLPIPLEDHEEYHAPPNPRHLLDT